MYRDWSAGSFRDTICSPDILVLAGRLRGRSVAPHGKIFTDRSFFRGHTPPAPALPLPAERGCGRRDGGG
ncbi:MAG: hypothetical protein QFX32_04930 [Methanolinea sp.]|nr:hypothetical protein [Methanolinea sp.]